MFAGRLGRHLLGPPEVGRDEAASAGPRSRNRKRTHTDVIGHVLAADLTLEGVTAQRYDAKGRLAANWVRQVRLYFEKLEDGKQAITSL